LLILGPISTFGLAGVAVIAFWWNDWPGSRLAAPWTGVVDTLLVAAIAVVLTIAGQAVIERPDIGAVFEATPGPAAPTTFPATMALAGATFTAMLQLSLVCERWPLGRLGRFWSGIAALVLSWVIGAGAYFLFVNISYLPVAERVAVGVWQAVLFIALRGWPINTITRRSRRLLAGNTLVIGLGAGTYAVIRDAAGLSPGTIGAVCGCVIGAVLVVAMLFEGWPAALLRPAAGRALALAVTAVVALVLYRALAAYADGVRWIRAASEDWIPARRSASPGPGSSCTSASGSAGPSPGYGETPWRSTSRTISTRPYAPSLVRMREIEVWTVRRDRNMPLAMSEAESPLATTDAAPDAVEVARVQDRVTSRVRHAAVSAT
jgi:hypothetical protein